MMLDIKTRQNEPKFDKSNSAKQCSFLVMVSRRLHDPPLFYCPVIDEWFNLFDEDGKMCIGCHSCERFNPVYPETFAQRVNPDGSQDHPAYGKMRAVVGETASIANKNLAKRNFDPPLIQVRRWIW